MQTNGRQGGSHTPPPRTQVCYHVLPRRQPPGPRHQPRREKRNGLRPGSSCHGGLMVLPCGAMRGNCDNCSYSTTTLFVALISTYTHMHSVRRVPDSDIHTLPRFRLVLLDLLVHAPTFPSLHRSKGEVCARVCVVWALKQGCLRRLGLFCVVPSSLIRHSLNVTPPTREGQREATSARPAPYTRRQSKRTRTH